MSFFEKKKDEEKKKKGERGKKRTSQTAVASVLERDEGGRGGKNADCMTVYFMAEDGATDATSSRAKLYFAK